MSYLELVTSGATKVPRRTVVYGGHGVGKTTWAARWPEPILVPIEDGYHHVDVPTGPRVTSLDGLCRALAEVKESSFRTVIVDSIDWLERIVQQELDNSSFDQSWGKGQVEVASRLCKVLKALDACRDAGKHVVVIGHEQQKIVTRPDGGSFAQHGLKLNKHTTQVVVEWCDELLFVQRDYRVRATDSKAGGVGLDMGTRSLYTTQTPAYDAKNRIVGLPEKFDLSDVNGYLDWAIEKSS